MNMREALAIACEALEIRRQQWEGVSTPDHCMDGDPSDLIPELYETEPEEAAAIAAKLADAGATLHDLYEQYGGNNP